MGWITLANEKQKEGLSDPAGQKVAITDLAAGQVFSLNTQSRKFELESIDIGASEGFPQGRIVAKVVDENGVIGDKVSLDFGLHRGVKVNVWGQVGDEAVTKAPGLYEMIKLKGSDAKGVVVNVDRSKFPDCGITVMWESPMNGRMISEAHIHELESLGKVKCGQDEWGEGRKSLAEIRQIVLDLRGNYDQKYENLTRKKIQDQVAQAMAQHASEVKALDDAQKAEVAKVCSETIQQFAKEIKGITDACVLHVSAGELNYETDEIGEVLFNYADSVHAKVASLSRDPSVVAQASVEVLNLISDSALKSYFMTREGTIHKEKGKYTILSQKGKKLGSYPSKKKAVNRLRQIEYFKRTGGTIEELEGV